MRSLLHIIAASLLLFSGVVSLYSGWNLILNPDGNSLPVSLTWIQDTWFQHNLIPGIIILVVSGVFGLFTFAAMVLDLRNYAMLILLQGATLFGWMILQIIFTNNLEPTHVVFGLIGAILIFVGWRLTQEKFQYHTDR
jgi:hypothetical protein